MHTGRWECQFWVGKKKIDCNHAHLYRIALGRLLCPFAELVQVSASPDFELENTDFGPTYGPPKHFRSLPFAPSRPCV
jgi:hypothetical protein